MLLAHILMIRRCARVSNGGEASRIGSARVHAAIMVHWSIKSTKAVRLPPKAGQSGGVVLGASAFRSRSQWREKSEALTSTRFTRGGQSAGGRGEGGARWTMKFCHTIDRCCGAS